MSQAPNSRRQLPGSALFSSRSALLLTTLGMAVGTCLVQWAVALAHSSP